MTLLEKVLDKLGFTKQTLIRFVVIALGSQFIYSINALRSVLYDPFVETMNITNTQMGFLFSTVALVGMIAYIPGAWFTDRFSGRKIMTFSLVFVGLSSFYFATSPAYPVLLFIFVMWGFCQEGPFWGSVLKSVRVTAKEDKQGTAFGALELVRGSTEFFTNALAIMIFAYVGESVVGMKAAMMINGGFIILCGVLVWFFLPEDDFLEGETSAEKNTEVMGGIKKAVMMPETWLTGLTVCGIYTIYVGVQWFVPFLTKVYGLPIALAAVFGLFNTSFTRMLASPTGGYVADNKFGSSVRFMRAFLFLVSLFIGVVLMLPKTTELLYPVMAMMICVTVVVYMLRGVYFAPIGEMHVPKAMSGAALSVAAMIGYSPAFWLNTVNGYLLDTYTPEEAYRRIFMIMICGGIGGVICTSIMYKRVKKFKAEQANIENAS